MTRPHQLNLSAQEVGRCAGPLAWDRDITHVARDLDASVLVVGADRLGTLSHVRTSLQYLYEGWLRVAAVVLSTPVIDSSTGTNVASLRRMLGSWDNLGDRIVSMPRETVELESGTALALEDWITAVKM